MKPIKNCIVLLTGLFATILSLAFTPSAEATTCYISFRNNDANQAYGHPFNYTFKNTGGTTQWTVFKYDASTGESKGVTYYGNNQQATIDLSPSYFYIVNLYSSSGYVDGSTTGYTKSPFMVTWYNSSWYGAYAFLPSSGAWSTDWKIEYNAGGPLITKL